MARLERGLSRRVEEKEASPDTSSTAAPAPFAPERDDRLKSAIDNLQRIAARRL